MTKYIVTGGPIEHGTSKEDVRRYERGDAIELTDEQSKQLLALGEIEELAPKAKAGRKGEHAAPDAPEAPDQGASPDGTDDGEGPQE